MSCDCSDRPVERLVGQAVEAAEKREGSKIHLSESEAALYAARGLTEVTQKGNKWMSAAWRVGKDRKIELQGVTTWDFPTDFEIAIAQLVKYCMDEKVRCSAVLPATPLPPADFVVPGTIEKVKVEPVAMSGEEVLREAEQKFSTMGVPSHIAKGKDTNYSGAKEDEKNFLGQALNDE